MVLLARLQRLRRRGAHIPAGPLKLMLGLLVAMLALGLAGIPVMFFTVDYYRPRNLIAWNLALLLHAYYWVVWRLWIRTGFPTRRP